VGLWLNLFIYKRIYSLFHALYSYINLH